MKKVLTILIAVIVGGVNTLAAETLLPKIKQSDQVEKVLNVATFEAAELTPVYSVGKLEIAESYFVAFESVKRQPVNLIYSVRRNVWPGYNLKDRPNTSNPFKILHLDPGLII